MDKIGEIFDPKYEPLSTKNRPTGATFSFWSQLGIIITGFDR